MLLNKTTLRSKTTNLLLIISFLFPLSNSSAGVIQKIFIPKVPAVEQRLIENINVYEGCGPVAAAMLLGYYHLNKDLDIFDQTYSSYKHPTEQLKWLRRELFTKAAPVKSGSLRESYTLPHHLRRGLSNIIKSKHIDSNYTLKTLSYHTPTRHKFRALRNTLASDNPVILLIRSLPPCITGKKTQTNWAWHYVVVNGIDQDKKQIHLLDGFQSGSTEDTASPNNEYGPVRTCSIDEISKTHFGMYWIEKKLQTTAPRY